jgi:serine protease inhibitor
MRRFLTTATVCTGLLLASACQSHTSGSAGDAAAHLQASQVRMAKTAPNVSYDALSHGQLALGRDLAGRLTGDQGNLVYSPASLAIAFAMLREGAVGPTARAIDSVLHLPADRQVAYNGLLHALAEPGGSDVLDVNDGLFLDPSLRVRAGYLDALKQWYGAGIERVPFPGPALAAVNSWVDRGTHGRIPHLLDHLDPTSVFVLANTIYLDAKWQHPFDPGATSSQPFRTGAGTSVSVKTMHQTASFDYVRGDGWQAVRLPYRGGRMSMWVLLPKTGADPRKLLSASILSGLPANPATSTVRLSLPRWDISTVSDLAGALQSLGLTHVFNGAGDFSALTPDSRFSVTRVLQQADITVGEKGTKAAAATAIIGETMGAVPAPDPVTFTADHPFAFVVMHDATGVPLFEGVVADPS